MSRKKSRRTFTPQEKVSISREHLVERQAVSDLCEKHGMHPNVFYKWQKQFFENGKAAFEPDGQSGDRQLRARTVALEDKLRKKDEVISELLEDHVRLKKNSWGNLKAMWVAQMCGTRW